MPELTAIILHVLCGATSDVRVHMETQGFAETDRKQMAVDTLVVFRRYTDNALAMALERKPGTSCVITVDDPPR